MILPVDDGLATSFRCLGPGLASSMGLDSQLFPLHGKAGELGGPPGPILGRALKRSYRPDPCAGRPEKARVTMVVSALAPSNAFL